MVQHKHAECLNPNLQCREVPRKLFDDGLQGAGVGLGVTHQTQVEQEGVPAVLLVLDAHRAAD